MSKSIYEKAKGDLISLTAKFVIPNVDETDYGCIYDRCHFYNILDEQEESYLKNVEQVLEQAQKQEQERVEYSKKVQEQFSNDTKRIGELESKLISQEKLLELYKSLITIKNYELSCCEVVDDDYYDIETIRKTKIILRQIKELEVLLK